MFGVGGLVLGVGGLGVGVRGLGLGFGLWNQRSTTQSTPIRNQNPAGGFRVEGSGLGVEG
jgi:hypothetical protein